jgi:competence protein ComEC
MSTVHFLNVLDGDCNIIQHDSSRVTVIDVSNAYNSTDTEAEKAAKAYKDSFVKENYGVPEAKTNWKQKALPDNPIDYLKKFSIKDIWRFIITHPDMDHLDGIKDLFSEFSIVHTWDTNNDKSLDTSSSSNFSGYNKEDWDFYKQLRAGQNTATKRITPFSGDERQFWQDDFIKILCPTPGLVKKANETGDYNDASYAFLYTPPRSDGGVWKILFAGDTHDDSWDYILENHREDISNIDVLFAPHHGRDSKRKYDFVKVLRPRLTLFGNAKHNHLAYSSYPKIRLTNNQAGYVIISCKPDNLFIYVKNQAFANSFRAKRGWEASTKSNLLDAFLLCSFPPRKS